MGKIIVFTDTHMEPEVAEGKLNPDVQLQKGIAHVNEFNADADRVVFVGDLTDVGDKQSYNMLRSRLKDLKIPYHLLLGNHDNRENFLEIFPDIKLDKNGFVQDVIETPEANLILLDTLNGPPYNYPESHIGKLCEKRMSWLEAQLDRAGDKPCIIFMHHPPHDTHFSGMDLIKLAEHEAFYELIKRYDNVHHIVAGHVHRTISGSHQGVPFSVFKSTVGQMPMLFDAMACHLEVNEPSAYGIIFVNSDSIIVQSEDFELTDLKKLQS